MRKYHGFTLLELLIAIALSTMVMGMLSAGMYLVLRDWEQTETRLETKLETALGLLQIERALQGAFPHLYREREKNRPHIFFEGEEDKLAWVSTVSPGRAPGLHAWLLQSGKEGRGLQVSYAPALVKNPAEDLEKASESETRSTLLFEHYRVSFEYLLVDETRDPDDDGREEWLEEWSGEERRGLPVAVRMKLEHKDDDEKSLEMLALILANEHFNLPPIIKR